MPDSEFALIRDYFMGWGEGPAVRLGIGDDAAALSVPEGHVLQISTDTAVEGVHFLPTLAPAEVAYRSLMAAASDLAAMGASPLACLLSLTLPEVESNWLPAFSRGLYEATAHTELSLVGGDTTRGPLSVTVTVLGSTPATQFMTRAGAQPGDRLCVSGQLGDAAAGLAISAKELTVDDARNADLLVTRYERPTARLILGQALRECATACIDISDGLLADAGHVAAASGVAIHIDSTLLPLSEALCASVALPQAQDWALAGGDDYELLFTLPGKVPLPEGCTEIGRVHAGGGISCDRTPECIGYDHFAR